MPGLPAPRFGMATSFEQARRIAADIGYPVLVRPSYVLGGRGMEIVYDDETLRGYITRATELSPEHPVLVDRFLEDAIEIDVDALCDGAEVYIGGVMEHIEEAGIHSGDSACALPPVTLGRQDIAAVRHATEAIAHGIGVVGLLNVQYALKDDVLYVLEANPRASRTVPFVSKATAVPLAKACARIMLGASIAQLREEGVLVASGDGASVAPHAPIAVKEAVLPFHRFRKADGSQVDSLLGPEMKSTGEVMGIDRDFGTAFAKSQTAAYGSLPAEGTVFVSVANRDKRSLVFPVKRLADLGFRVLATEGTAEMLRRNGIPCDEVRKHFEAPSADRPALSAVDAIRAGEVDMVINTPYGNSGPRIDGYEIRSAAVAMNIPCVTTVQGASAAVQGIEAGIRGDIGVRSLQELHSQLERDAVTGFGTRLADAMSARGPLCLGIDPHPELLTAWGLSADADGLRAFCDVCVQAYAGFAVVKPQVAFFETYGAAGYSVLERVIAALREAGVLVLADAKRGDIGTTMAAYAAAWAGDSPLASDAVTASPYLGFGSLQPLLDTAARHDRGVFVLAATSNPEGASVQGAIADGRTVAQSIVDDVAAVNRTACPRLDPSASSSAQRFPTVPDLSDARRPRVGARRRGARRATGAPEGARGSDGGYLAARGVPRGAEGRARRRGGARGRRADARRGRPSGRLSCDFRHAPRAVTASAITTLGANVNGLHRDPHTHEPEAPASAVAGLHRGDLLAVPVERLMVLAALVDAAVVPVHRAVNRCCSTGCCCPLSWLSLLLCRSCPHGGRSGALHPAGVGGCRAEADAQQSSEPDSGGQRRRAQGPLEGHQCHSTRHRWARIRLTAKTLRWRTGLVCGGRGCALCDR